MRLTVEDPSAFQALLTQMDSFLPLLDPPDDVDSRGVVPGARRPPELMGNASKFWTWDEHRLCQAYVRHPDPTAFLPRLTAQTASGIWVITPRPCSWGLGFVCVAEADALAAGFTSASAWYRRHLAPGAPEATQPSPYAQGPQGSGLVLLRSGLVLGDPTPGRGITAPTGEWADVTVAFDDSEAFWAEGPVLSYISRNQLCAPAGLLLLRPGAFGDAYRIWQRAYSFGVPGALGYWRGVMGDAGWFLWDTAFVDPSMYDYVVSVQGCFREDSLERLMLVTRTGRRYQLGIGGCTYAFREDAPPGGYLAGVAGRYIDWYAVPGWWTWPVLPRHHNSWWFTRLQLVWAAPEGSGQPTFALSSPSVLVPSPALAADGAGSTCPAGAAGGLPIASRVLPPRELWVSVCGPQANASCPSQLCCGDRFLGPGNVSYVTCAASAAACQAPACLPGYGVCGGSGVPEAQQVVFVRSDPARQDWPPPRSAEAGGGSGSGGGGATTVYAIRPRAASGGAWYQNAVAYCRSSSLMGLSWSLIGRADLMGWVDSLDMRAAGVNADTALKATDGIWLATDDDYVNSRPEGGCVKGVWKENVLGVFGTLDISNGFFGSSCRADGTVICKASGAQNRSTLVASGSAAWGPGIHSLSTSPAFGGGPTATCRYALGPAETANGGSSSSSSSSSGSNGATPAAALPWPIARIDLSITDQLFPDGCQSAVAVVAGVRLWLRGDASAAGAEPSQVAGSETSGGWHRFELAAGEVVTGVSGCAGGYVERLVFHTSLGRLWTTPFSAASLCSASFAAVAPPGGYLVGLQGESGAYLHSVQMVWGLPLASGGAAAPPPPAAAAGPAPAPTPTPAAVQPPSLLTSGGSGGAGGNATAESGGSSGGVSAGAVAGAAVGAAMGVALIGAAAAVLVVRRRRRIGRAAAAKPSEPSERRKQGGGGGGTGGAVSGSESTSAVENGSVVVRVGEDPSAAAVGPAAMAHLWTHKAPTGPNGLDGTASVLQGTEEQYEKRLAAYMLGLNSVRQAASSADSKWALSSDAMPTSTHQGAQSVGAGSDGESSLASMVSRAQAELGGAQEHLRIDGVLGRGSFGVVYLGTWRGLLVAVKTLVVHDALMGREGRQRHRAILEAAISKSLEHPHVVTTYAYSLVPLGVVGARGQGQGQQEQQGPAQQAEEGQAPAAKEGKAKAAGDSQAQGPSAEKAPDDADVYKLLLIQEFCDLGSLTDALGAGVSGSIVAGGVEALCALSIALDVACGMSYIHARNIVHGDLSPGNVLLSSRASEEPSSHGLAPTQGDPSASRSSGQVPGGGWRPPVHAKVADFGLSLPMQGDQTHASNCFQGTPSHTAPEVLIQGRLSKAADVWAFGVLLLELCHGTPIRNIRAKAAAAAAAAGGGAALLVLDKDAAAGEGSPDQGTAPGAVDGVAVPARTPPWAVPPPGLPPPLAPLVTACLALEPAARPTFAEVADALGRTVGELTAQHVAAAEGGMC